MESFLLFCNGSLVILVVVLTIMDAKRKPGEPRQSPFRINEALRAVARKAKSAPYQRPMPTRRRRT